MKRTNQFNCCDGVLIRNLCQISIKTKIDPEKIRGLPSLSLTLPQFLPLLDQDHQIYFMTLQTITSNDEIIGAKIWFHDLFTNKLEYHSDYFVMDELIHKNTASTVDFIEETVSQKFMSKILDWLEQNKNVCIMSFAIVSCLKQLKKWCTKLPGGLARFESRVKAFCDLRWLDKNDDILQPKAWSVYITNRRTYLHVFDYYNAFKIPVLQLTFKMTVVSGDW